MVFMNASHRVILIPAMTFGVQTKNRKHGRPNKENAEEVARVSHELYRLGTLELLPGNQGHSLRFDV